MAGDNANVWLPAGSEPSNIDFTCKFDKFFVNVLIECFPTFFIEDFSSQEKYYIKLSNKYRKMQAFANELVKGIKYLMI